MAYSKAKLKSSGDRASPCRIWDFHSDDWRMPSGMWRHVGLVRSDVSEERRLHLQGRKNLWAKKNVSHLLTRVNHSTKIILNKNKGKRRQRWAMGMMEYGGGCSIVIKARPTAKCSEVWCWRGTWCIQVPDVLVLTLCCKLINFLFQILLLFIPEMFAGFTSYLFHTISLYTKNLVPIS
jgi:hypothetical protein